MRSGTPLSATVPCQQHVNFLDQKRLLQDHKHGVNNAIFNVTFWSITAFLNFAFPHFFRNRVFPSASKNGIFLLLEIFGLGKRELNFEPF